MAAYVQSAVLFNTTAGNKSPTITPAVGNLLVVAVAHSGEATAPTVTDDRSGTYTLIETATRNAGASGSWFFVRDQLITSAVLHTLTIVPGAVDTGGGGVVAEISGMTRVGAAAVRSSGHTNNVAAGGAVSVTMNQAANGSNPTLMICASNDNTTTVTTATNYTNRQNPGFTAPTSGLRLDTRDSGETNSVLAFGGTTTSAGSGIAVELDSSSIALLTATDPNYNGLGRVSAFLDDEDAEYYDYYYAPPQDGMVEAIVDEAVPPLITEYNTDRSNGRALHGGSGVGINEAQAQGVTLARTSLVSTIQMALDSNGSPADTVVLDVVSSLTGSAIASASVAAASVPSAAAGGGLVVFSFTPFSLEGGVLYFLRVTRSGARDTVNNYDVNGQSSPAPPQAAWTRGTGVWSVLTSGYEYHVFGSQQGAAPSWIAPPPVEQDTAYQADPDEEHFNWYAQKLDGSVESFIAGAPAGGGGPSDAELVAADPNYSGAPRIGATLDDVDDEPYDYYTGTVEIVAAFSRAIATGRFASLVLSDNPLAYWRLGESAGPTAFDSGHSYDGTYQGSPAGFSAPGLAAPDADTALNADGVDDAIVVVDAPDDPLRFDGTEPWTLFSIIKVPAGETSIPAQITTELGGGGQVNFMLGSHDGSSDTLKPSVGFYNGSWNVAIAPTNVSLDVAHVVMGTWDGSALRIYVDGLLAATNASPTGLPQSPTPDRNIIRLLNRWDASTVQRKFFLGVADELVIFPTALDAKAYTYYSVAFEIPERIAQMSVLEPTVDLEHDDYDYWSPDHASSLDVSGFVAGPPVTSDAYIAALDLPDHTDQPDEDEAWDFYDPFIDGAEAVLGFLVVEDEIANAAQLDAAAGQEDDQLWTLVDPTDIAPFVEQAEAIVGFLTVEDEIAEAAQLDRSVGQDDDQAWVAADPTDVAPFIDGAEAILGFLTVEDEIAEAAQLPRDLGWFPEDFEQANDPTDIRSFTEQAESFIAGPPLFADDGYVATVDVFDHSDQPAPDDAFDFYATTQEGTEWLIGFLTPDAEIAEAAQPDRSVGQDDDQAWIAGDATDTASFADGAEAILGFLAPSDEIAQATQPAPDVGWSFEVIVVDDTEEQSVETAHIQPEEYIAGSTVADDPLYLAQTYVEQDVEGLYPPEWFSEADASAYPVDPMPAFFPPVVRQIADTFTRGDSTALGVTEIGAAPWEETLGDWAITSGQLQQTAAVTNALAVVDLDYVDHVVSADLVDASAQEFVVARLRDPDNYLIAGFQAAETTLRLYKYVGASFTQVGSAPAGVHASRLAIWTEGDLVTVYVNDVPLITYTITDAALRTGTRAGFLTSNATAARFDNFNAVSPQWIEAATQLLPRDDEAGLADWEGFDYAQLDAASSLDVSAYTAGPPITGDDYIATTALVPDASDQPAPDEAWDGWAYPVEASEWFVGFLAPDAEIADAAQDHTVGQDDDQLWTLVDPTDSAPFLDGIEYLTGFLVPSDEIAQAAQPHYGDWQDWREAEQTEDYANDSTIGVEDTTSAPDAFDLTIATQPDPSIGQDDDALWTITDPTVGEDQPFVDETEWLTGFLTVEDEIAEAAQLDRSVGQDDDATWTGTDPTDIVPFLDGVEALTRPDDAFEVTIGAQLGTDVGQDLDLLFPPDLSQLDTGYVEQAEAYVAGPPAFAPDAETIASQPAETGIDVEGRWPEWDGTDATPFLDGAEWLIGFTVPDVEITIAAQPSRAEDTAVDNPDRIEWTEETDPATTLDLSPLVRPDDPIEVTYATQLDSSVGQDDDQWWTLLDPTDTTPFIDEQEEAIAGSTTADDPIYAAQTWPDLATTEYAPEETQDYANDTALDLSALTPAPDSTDTTFAAQLDPSVGQDDDQSWIATDPTDIWPFTDQLEAFEEIVLPDEGIAATQDYSDNQYEPEALWAPDSLADGSIEVLASLSDQATLAAAGALSEPASELEDEAWPIYLALPDQSGEFAATQLDIALVAALDLTPAPVEEPKVWTPEVALADGVEQVAVTAEAAVTVAAQPTFDAYDWTTFEEPVADLSTIERRPTPLQPTARPEIVGMTALVDPGVDLVALKDPEVGFPQGGGFSSGFSSGFARGGGSGELDALAESEGYAMGPYGAPAPDHVSALEGEVEQIDALSDPDVDVT